MRKILYFVSEDWYFASHRLELAKAAVKEGYDVTLMTRLSIHKDEIEAAGIKTIDLKRYSRSRNIIKSILSIIEIVNCYKKEKADIIHHVALKPIVFGTLASFFTKTPKIIQAVTGLGQGFQKTHTRFLLKNLLRITLNGSNKIVLFQNNDDKEQLTQVKALKAKTQTCLIRGAGIDTKKYRPLTSPKGKKTRVALIARMLKHKGVKEFVDAAKLLKEKNIEMILVGSPDTDAPSSLSIEELTAWDKQGIITYHGHTSNPREIWQKCHIATLPSYSEGLPKALLEAAACGRPMIATNVAGNKDICIDQKTGFLIPVKDPTSLAQAIEKLAGNKRLQEKFGDAARKLVETEFSLEKVIKETLKLYRG